MTKQQAIQFFGTQQKLAEALGIKQHTISGSWSDRPPALRQLQIERITKGKLKADEDCAPFRVK
jgi:DNA-binding transcriptional regulator YdaS (Cro superfamily)